MYVSSFVDYYRPLAPTLPMFDIDIQNTLEYSRQNLLDDNGDLLPFQKYNAGDEEIHGSIIAHLGEYLSWDAGGSYRYKNFEEQSPFPSIDFQEIRADTGIRWKVPWWADGRLKVRYVFRYRSYFDLQANERDGSTAKTDPTLRLDRHQVRTSFSQKLPDVFDLAFAVTVGYTFTYNRDTFQGDRSYREHAGSGRIECWVVRDWTRVELEVRGGLRGFLVPQSARASPDTFAYQQSYVDSSFLFWQKIHGPLSLFAEAGYFIYHSDALKIPPYKRLLLQIGVEASF
jgi:hypothetical protein